MKTNYYNINRFLPVDSFEMLSFGFGGSFFQAEFETCTRAFNSGKGAG
jgi:hypothetical protein